MPSYNWPRTGDCPQDIAKHAGSLKIDFDLVSKAVDSSLSPSRSATLPSTLEPSILTGIEKGIAEARNKGYCPKWSKVDEIVFRNVMLKNIATEAALQIRDRVPLDQFNGLHKSYNALHAKLVPQLPPAVTSHQSVRVDAPIQAKSVDKLAEASNGTNTAVEIVHASRQSVTSPRENKDQGVAEKKGDDSSKEAKSGEGESEEKESEEKESEEKESEEKESEEAESEEEESEEEESDEEESDEEGSEEEEMKEGASKKEERTGQDPEDGQAATDSEGSETGSGSSADGSCDSSSGAEEESEDDGDSDSDADCDNDQVQEVIREDTVRRAVEDISGPPTTIKLEIKDQATVNRLEDMRPWNLLETISCSLEDHLGQKQLSSAGVRISAAHLLASGDVKVTISQNKHVRQPIIRDLKGWDQRLERTVIGSHVPTYKVLVYSVRTKSLVFRNRKEKSKIISKLTDANRSIGDKNSVRPIIRDIYWAGNSSTKAKATLVVEFMDSEQANQALLRGLLWQQRRYGCERADKKSKLLRCSRCQAYGHLMADCLAPYCCGTCSGEHSTWTCKSKIRKCGSCGGDHRAGNNRCPEKIQAKKDLEFTNEDTPQATKPATEATRTPPTIAQRSTSAGTTQTKASMPSPVSLDAESADDDVESEPKQPLSEVETPKDSVESEPKQPLPEVETAEDNVESTSKQFSPQADSPQDIFAELATLRHQFEDFTKRFVVLDTKLQSQGSGGTKRRADEAFVNGAGAESSGVAAKRIKKEEPTQEDDSMSLYLQPSVYSENRPD